MHLLLRGLARGRPCEDGRQREDGRSRAGEDRRPGRGLQFRRRCGGARRQAAPQWLRRRAPTARGRTAPTGFLGSLRICSASFSPTSYGKVVRSHDCLEACSIRHGNKAGPRTRWPYILFSFMSNLMGFPEALTLPNRRGVASFRKGCAWAGGHMLLARSSSRFAVSVLVGRPIGDIPDTIFDSRSRRRPSRWQG